MGALKVKSVSPLQGDPALEFALLTGHRVDKPQALRQQLQRIGIVILDVFQHLGIKRIVADARPQRSHVDAQLMFLAGHRKQSITPQIAMLFPNLHRRFGIAGSGAFLHAEKRFSVDQTALVHQGKFRSGSAGAMAS